MKNPRIVELAGPVKLLMFDESMPTFNKYTFIIISCNLQSQTSSREDAMLTVEAILAF